MHAQAIWQECYTEMTNGTNFLKIYYSIWSDAHCIQLLYTVVAYFIMWKNMEYDNMFTCKKRKLQAQVISLALTV